MIFLLKLSLTIVAPLALYSCLCGMVQMQQVTTAAAERFTHPVTFTSIPEAQREIRVDAQLCDYLDRATH